MSDKNTNKSKQTKPEEKQSETKIQRIGESAGMQGKTATKETTNSTGPKKK